MSEIKVLVVDDSTTMRKIITDSLSKIGFSNIIQAGDGQVALTKLSDVELILTDWNMPNMNGLDFVKSVRRMPDYAKIPIVMVTTEAGKGEVVEALRNGVNNYIVKPFTPAILKEKLSAVIDI